MSLSGGYFHGERSRRDLKAFTACGSYGILTLKGIYTILSLINYVEDTKVWGLYEKFVDYAYSKSNR